jgi:hypothetical protein
VPVWQPCAQATLAELAEATGVTISDVRLALRRLAYQLKPAGMQVLDDGSRVQLAAERRFHRAVAHLLQPEQQPRLTQEQAEVLAIVIADGMCPRCPGGPGARFRVPSRKVGVPPHSSDPTAGEVKVRARGRAHPRSDPHEEGETRAAGEDQRSST